MTEVAERNTFAGIVHDSSSDDGVAVTKSDTATIRHTRGIYVGGTGDLVVRTLRGTTLTFVAVPAGALLPIRVDMVMSATTATSIVALF